MKRSKEQQEMIANRIREKRRELKMQQKELAKEAYISQSDMCKIEKANKWLESDELRRIADALGVDTGYLLGTLEHETKEKTDIAEVLPLDSDAIDLLLELKKSTDNSKEAQYISDLISFFIKSILGDACGESGHDLGVALANLSYWYDGEQLLSNFSEDKFYNENRRTRTNIIAAKEEVREASTKVFVEFCRNNPIHTVRLSENEMLISEIVYAVLGGDMETAEELGRELSNTFEEEGDDNGNV